MHFLFARSSTLHMLSTLWPSACFAHFKGKLFCFWGMREGVTMLFGEGKDRGTPSHKQAKPVGSPPHNFSTARVTEIQVVAYINLWP
jgi:hypothetical protein